MVPWICQHISSQMFCQMPNPTCPRLLEKEFVYLLIFCQRKELHCKLEPEGTEKLANNLPKERKLPLK